MKVEHILVIGATSAIVHETSRLFAASGARFVLVARSHERLEAVARDLTTVGANAVHVLTADLSEFARHDEIMAFALSHLPSLDLVLIGHGTLGDQARAEADRHEALREIELNFLSYVSLLTLVANHMAAARRGVIAAISSVAGDRGRRSNYIYGAAKAGLTAFLDGLRARMFASGVHVVTVKPGMIDTPMTAHLEKGPLFAPADVVARGIHRAVVKRCDVVYLPRYWELIMLVIRCLPTAVFKRLTF